MNTVVESLRVPERGLYAIDATNGILSFCVSLAVHSPRVVRAVRDHVGNRGHWAPPAQAFSVLYSTL